VEFPTASYLAKELGKEEIQALPGPPLMEVHKRSKVYKKNY
jgi:hypothetical protein